MARSASLRHALAGALLCLAAAAAAAAAPDGSQAVTVPVGAQKRTCVVHLTPPYDGRRALLLVIAIHAAGGTGAAMVGCTGSNPLARSTPAARPVPR